MIIRNLEQILESIIVKLTPENTLKPNISFSRFSDVSSNISFLLAPILKNSPVKIADTIIENFHSNDIKDIVSLNGGFLNFTFTENALKNELIKILSNSNYGEKKSNGKKVNIEFISANPTGPLVLVNARAGFTGMLLSNIMQFAGYETKKEYYVNDSGNQIEMLGMSILHHISSNGPDEFPENGYRGAYIKDIAKTIEKETGKLDWNNENIKKCSEMGIKYILKWQKESLKEFGIKFDTWIYESNIRKSGFIDKTIELLKEKDLLEKKDNAVFFKSSSIYDDKDRVIIKSDGTYSYLLPDAAYHFNKIERGYDIIIDILGPDHHGYINRLKSAVHIINKETEIKILIAQLITLLKDGKKFEMSKRQGDFITFDELKENIDIDVLKFIFLMRKMSQPINFDIEEAKKQTMDNPVYYVQYAHARICSVFDKVGIMKCPDNIDEKIFIIPEARGLVLKMMEYPYIIYSAAQTFEIQKIGVYLTELSGLLHKFYHNHRIISDNIDDMNNKIILLWGVRQIIANGLRMMSIKPKTRMENNEVQ